MSADDLIVTMKRAELRELIRSELVALVQAEPPRALITRSELAEQLGCCERTVRRLEDDGLPRVQLGDSPRYRLEAVLNWLERRSAVGEAAE